MRQILFRMASSVGPEAVSRMKARADQAEAILKQLSNQINLLKQAAVSQAYKGEEDALKLENDKLKNEINEIKSQLVIAEIRNGVRQVSLPAKRNMSTSAGDNTATPSPAPSTSKATPAKAKKSEEKPQKQDKKPEKDGEAKGGKKGGKAAAPAEPERMDISRLDLRIGRIVSAQKHPDADSLYIEDVDIGEEKRKTIVSGLVKHVPLDQMQNRLAVFMLNLKPSKMRGVLSEGMIMCASSPEKVEILVPPGGVKPGDRVSFEGYSGEPDGQLNPKKKVWETLKPDVKTDSKKVATYKGVPFKIEGKGIVTAPTLANTQIS